MPEKNTPTKIVKAHREGLWGLIQELTSSEWDGLVKQLTCFNVSTNKESKQLQLANYLRYCSAEPNETAICVKLYGVRSCQTFHSLKNTLREKIFDFLLNDINLDKLSDLEKSDLAIIRIKKKSALFQQLLYSKSRNQIYYSLLDEIIALATEFEHHYSLIEHLRLKKVLVEWKKNTKEFNKLQSLIKYHTRCYDSLNLAEHYYYEFGLKSEYFSNKDKEALIQFGQSKVTELKALESELKLGTLRYYRLFIELGINLTCENYSIARTIALKLLDLVRKSKALYRRQRIGVILDHLSRCEFHLVKYSAAAEWAREAQKHFNSGSENLSIALEQEYYALMAGKSFNHAFEASEKMVQISAPIELGAFRFSKFQFLKANALFRLGRFDNCFTILSQELKISEDKAGWEVGIRILKTMTLIELLKYDEASHSIHNLKHFIIYTEKQGMKIRPRDKKILNLLQNLMRNSYNFSTLNGNTPAYLEALNSAKSDSAWEPFTHEVFPFQEWFEHKLKQSNSSIILSFGNKNSPAASSKSKVPVRI